MAAVKTLIGNIKGPKGDTGEKGDTGAKGDIGATGRRGSRWNSGTAITGTSTTATIFSGSGISDALVSDMYLNTSTGNTYRCTVSGAASVAKWVYVGNIKGTKGNTGAKGDKGDTGAKGDIGATGRRGSRWNSGTAITGTSTTATIFSGSGISDALVSDMYLNTSTGNTYRCTVSGAASVAKWVYVGNIKGTKGDTGAKGDKGDTGATGPRGPQGKYAAVDSALSATSTNPVQNKVVQAALSNKLGTTGDTKNNIVSFSSADSTSPTKWTDVAVLASGEKHSSLFNKISTMFKNIRWLYKMLGTTDISGIGNGTVTGGLSALNSNLIKYEIHSLSNISISANSTVVFNVSGFSTSYDVDIACIINSEYDFVIGSAHMSGNNMRCSVYNGYSQAQTITVSAIHIFI